MVHRRIYTVQFSRSFGAVAYFALGWYFWPVLVYIPPLPDVPVTILSLQMLNMGVGLVFSHRYRKEPPS